MPSPGLFSASGAASGRVPSEPLPDRLLAAMPVAMPVAMLGSPLPSSCPRVGLGSALALLGVHPAPKGSPGVFSSCIPRVGSSPGCSMQAGFGKGKLCSIAFLFAGPEAGLVSTSQEAHVLEIFPCGVVVSVAHGQEDLLASDMASVMEIVFSFLTGHSHRPQIRLEESS